MDNSSPVGVPDLLLGILHLLGVLMLILISCMPHFTCHAFWRIWQWRVKASERTWDHDHDAAFYCLPFFAHLILALLGLVATHMRPMAFGMKLTIMLQFVLLWSTWACIAVACLVLATLARGVILLKRAVDRARRLRMYGKVRNVGEETALLELDKDGNSLERGNTIHAAFDRRTTIAKFETRGRKNVEDHDVENDFQIYGSPVDSVLEDPPRIYTQKRRYQ
ncbi:hypothetical protein LTR56_013083 [Elasticomyces elasticus]|nr:hypothetical protein LTR56_013083 [Elasticomyces elasticus]KAK3640262.1 hypothetical protein LTR22_017097 [Elasticomyces elasticus]KAK4920539.1 hypothetical protein LTR49_011954 [Elasticomyces elasticus]KAK5758961.1 hypothetical protein LTS12_010902 [Elasticomyces elasticus]